MMSIIQRDRNMVVWIKEHVQPANILVQFKRKKWSWAGHVMRRANNQNSTGEGGRGQGVG